MKNSALISVTANSLKLRPKLIKSSEQIEFIREHKLSTRVLPQRIWKSFAPLLPDDFPEAIKAQLSYNKQKLPLPRPSLGSDKQGHLRHDLALKKVYLFKYYQDVIQLSMPNHLMLFRASVQKYLLGSHTWNEMEEPCTSYIACSCPSTWVIQDSCSTSTLGQHLQLCLFLLMGSHLKISGDRMEEWGRRGR